MNDSAEPDPAEADVQDPFGFVAAARQKAERRRNLHNALAGSPPPEPACDGARARLEELLDAETLAIVDEHLLELLADEGEVAETQDVLTAIAASKVERKRTLVDALRGRKPQPRDERGRYIGFDGGARTPPPPPPPSHESWLVETIRTRSADRGAHF